MKSLLIGMTIGVAIGYIVRKMEDEGKFDQLHDEVSGLADKTKKTFKNAVDTGKNQVEYAKDRVESAVDKATSNNKPY